MTYPRYPAYKQSGVPWLGEVPEHWTVDRLKWTVDGCINGTWGDDATGINDIVCVRVADFDRLTHRVCADNLTYRSVADNDRRNRLLQKGDLLLEKSGGGENQPVGCVVLYDLDFEAVSSNFVARMPASDGFCPVFLCYLHTALYGLGINVWSIKQNTGLQNLDASAYLDQHVGLPPPAEQAAIAAYLDRETAQIDALVARLEQLVALLQEKRQALISHAVTKGLDPAAPMKPSGVEWLGEVPAHWEVVSIKHLVSTPITDGPHESPEFLDEGVPFVSAEAVGSGKIEFSKIRGFISRTDHERYSKKYLPRRGDIFVIKAGATTGVSAIVDTDCDFNIWSPLAAIRCAERVVPQFMLNVLRSRNLLDGISQSWSFGTQQNIGMGVIENLRIPVPPMGEQIEIVEHLKRETQDIERLNSIQEQAVVSLQERRAALITAAVTGQILVTMG